jgi:hypothetical protein
VAIVLAAGLAAFSRESDRPMKPGDPILFYYRFDGAPGHENEMANWTQISKGAYDSLGCLGSTKACKITNTTNDDGHPTSVPLASSHLPEQGAVNTQVVNKD